MVAADAIVMGASMPLNDQGHGFGVNVIFVASCFAFCSFFDVAKLVVERRPRSGSHWCGDCSATERRRNNGATGLVGFFGMLMFHFVVF